MARISLDRFNGVLPSRLARELPPGNGQKAENLDLRYGDFSPMKGTGSSVATVTSGTVSVHRTPSGTWLESTSDANFNNGQLNDPSVERVYVTGHAAYPEVWDNGTYYRNGVRTPTAAPTVALDEVDEFTQQDRQQASNDLIDDIKAAVLANITPTLLANGKPSDPGGGPIFLNHGTSTTPALPTTLDTQIAYLTPTTSGVVDIASDAYLQEPVLAGRLVTYSAQEYWAVGALWRPVGYDVDEAALSTALKALLTPPENVAQLIPDAVADQIAARIAGIADPASDPLALLIDRVNSAQDDVVTFQTRELTNLSRAYALRAQLDKLEAAIRAVDEYFVQWETRLLQILADYEYLIPAYVERVIETRAYKFTYVNEWGEESAPSAASILLEVDQNDAVDITIGSPPSTGAYVPFEFWRLYRSSTTDDGAEWQLVDEIAIGTLTYNDSKLQEELQEPLPSIIYTEPRSDMVNLCAGANGIMLGSVGNVLCACEAYLPFTFPREYEQSLKYDIVAITASGQSWFVLTEGPAYLVSGADPASLSVQELPRPQACVSKRSAVGVQGGALYASPDGICLVDTSGTQLLTSGAYKYEDWRALTPSVSVGGFQDNVYHLWLGTAGIRLSLYMDRGELSRTTVAAPGAVYTDLLTDTLYTVSGTSVLPNFTGSVQTGVYKSGVFPTNRQTFGWLQVVGAHSSVTVKTYYDGVLVSTKTITDEEPVRHVGGRPRTVELEVESTSRVTRVLLFTSTTELLRA